MPQKNKENSVFSSFRDCRKALLRFVSRNTRHESDVEDIVQETFLQTFAMDKKSKIQFPKVYLFKTAKHLTQREGTKVSTKLLDYVEDFDDAGLYNEEDSVFSYLDKSQEQEILNEALASLPDKCRLVTALRLLNGMKLKDIAEEVGISVSTAEKHLAKGIERCDHFVQARLNENNNIDSVNESSVSDNVRAFK